MALQLMLIVYVKYTSRRLCFGLKPRCGTLLINKASTAQSVSNVFVFALWGAFMILSCCVQTHRWPCKWPWARQLEVLVVEHFEPAIGH